MFGENVPDFDIQLLFSEEMSRKNERRMQRIYNFCNSYCFLHDDIICGSIIMPFWTFEFKFIYELRYILLVLYLYVSQNDDVNKPHF